MLVPISRSASSEVRNARVREDHDREEMLPENMDVKTGMERNAVSDGKPYEVGG